MIEHYWLPIDPGDLPRVAELLRGADVFTPTFAAPEVDLYDPTVYRRELVHHATTTELRIDRNVLTRVLGLLDGSSPTEQHRLAAGILAFAQCAKIQVEPNLALYEVAHLQGHDAAVAELSAFRVADDVHPGWWADIALGREDHPGDRPADVRPGRHDHVVDSSMPLRRWRRNYVLCLKLAELELRGGNALQRFREFLQWSYDDFILGGPSIALAARVLAPNAPRGGLLKRIRADDRERALAGVRNAAWDLTIVSEWITDAESQPERRQLALLTSFDADVHWIARAVTGVAGPTDSGEDFTKDDSAIAVGAGSRCATVRRSPRTLRDA